MIRPTLLIGLAAVLMPLVAMAQPGPGKGPRDPQRVQQPADDGTGEAVFGWELMTPEERAEHRARMRAAKTVEERERIRAENHARMQERAKERGVTLPERPRGRN